MRYECHDCEMSVDGLTCGKCGTELIHDEITKNGKTIQVSKCPKCEGMIKSPQCCGSDMEPDS